MVKRSEDSALRQIGLPFRFGLEAEVERFATRNRPDYGVTAACLGTLDYRELFRAFYGMHQLNIPHEIALHLNPAEMMAQYVAAQAMKEAADWRESLPGGFPDAVARLTASGYGFRGIVRMQHLEGANIYPTRSGDMQRRVKAAEATHPEAAELFMESLRSERVFSDRESSALGRFHDPNIDGNSKRLYIRGVKQLINARYILGQRRLQKQ